MTSTYDIYPAVDEDHNFPPVVRQAIATAPEIEQGYTQANEIGFNAKRFGAIGDGTVDDSAAILAAWTASNGDPVYLPKGKYLSSLAFTDGDIILTGPGKLMQKPGVSVITVKPTWGELQACSSVTSILAGPNPATATSTTILTKIVLSSNNYTDTKQGDLYWLTSEDIYPWSVAALGTGATIWQAEFIPVMGLGVDVTAVSNGGPLESSILTGVTSNATAVVQSFAPDTAGGGVLFVGSINGAFTSGENLKDSTGTIVGVAGSTYILSSKLLYDTYGTLPKLRKIPKYRTIIDVDVITQGNTDTIIGTAQRVTPIRLMGAFKPNVKARIENSYRGGVQFQSCFMPIGDLQGDKLPNIALTTESGYGYLCEINGCTEYGSFKVTGQNVRHGFTTNVTSGTQAFNSYLGWGTVKYNTVHDSVIFGAFASGFDTHEGAYFTEFRDCRSIFPASGNRYLTPGNGFTNRGFGTRFIDCTCDGAIDAFTEGGINLIAGFPYETVYQNVRAVNFARYGYYQASAAAETTSRIRIMDSEFRGNGRASNDPYYQTGIAVNGGKTDIIRTRVTRIGGRALWTKGDTVNLYLDGFTFDFEGCSNSTAAVFVQGTAVSFVVASYTILPRLDGALPASFIRNELGDTVYDVTDLRGPKGLPAATLTVTAGSPTIVDRKPQPVNTRIIEYLTNATWTCPDLVTTATWLVRGGGGGGGGGGTASSGSSVAVAGGAGGGAGTYTQIRRAVTPAKVYTINVGSGGAGGAGGTAGGVIGGTATSGSSSTVTASGEVSITGYGGSRGNPSGANSATAVSGGLPGNSGVYSTSPFPGTGGPSAVGGGSPLGYMAAGGSGGGGVLAGLGGSGGGSGSSIAKGSPGVAGGSTTTSGTAGTDAPANSGGGGGGGGAGADGGTGGAGGAGGSGYVLVVY